MAIPRRKRGSIDKELEPFQFGLDGKLVTSVDPTRILTVSDSGETRQDNFKSLKNIRYTDNGIRGVRGMTKINSTALSSHPKVRNIHHFSKSQPAESHVLVHAFNSGLTQSKVFKNDTAIPNTGDFSGTALHTDASGSGKGRFENAQLGRMLYCNGVETMVWGGDEARLSRFVIFDPNGTFLYDYTEKVQNTLTDSSNVATLKRASNIGSETKLLLHCDGSDASTTITDNSPVSPHTVTAVGNAQIDTAIKKFGTGGLLLDGTGDWATIPDDSDFVLSGGVWTFECWAKVSLAADSGLYAQAKSSATQDYMWIYIDTDGAVNLVINEATDAATGTVTLDTGASWTPFLTSLFKHSVDEYFMFIVFSASNLFASSKESQIFIILTVTVHGEFGSSDKANSSLNLGFLCFSLNSVFNLQSASALQLPGAMNLYGCPLA